MASSNDYLTYVLDICREVPAVSYKKMMGEYILYSEGIIFGGIYDNRFMVKKTESSSALGMKEGIPYPGGKPMILVDVEDAREVREIIENVIADLK